MQLLSVLLVEDHAQMRAALHDLLSQEFQVLEAVERGDEVLAAAHRSQPHVVVLDISLPGRSGLQILPDLRALLPHATIVMLTNHDLPAYRDAALRLGANAFLAKSSVPDLLDTIRSAITNMPGETEGPDEHRTTPL